MKEKSIPDFPKPNSHEIIHVYIKSELEKAGITLQQINIDGTVTTDKEVPEEIMTSIRQYATSKGITINFLTSG